MDHLSLARSQQVKRLEARLGYTQLVTDGTAQENDLCVDSDLKLAGMSVLSAFQFQKKCIKNDYFSAGDQTTSDNLMAFTRNNTAKSTHPQQHMPSTNYFLTVLHLLGV